jgi:hypothetical protein
MECRERDGKGGYGGSKAPTPPPPFTAPPQALQCQLSFSDDLHPFPPRTTALETKCVFCATKSFSSLLELYLGVTAGIEPLALAY